MVFEVNNVSGGGGVKLNDNYNHIMVMMGWEILLTHKVKHVQIIIIMKIKG